MDANDPNPPTVFISYSHDSPQHQDRVLAFSNRLRSEGVDSILDQYLENPPAEGWPRWMDRQIRDADFVLMVCTEPYYRRVMGEEAPGRGLGVRWEGTLIYQYIYNAETTNTRFIPLLFEDAAVAHIPTPLQATTWYQLDEQYDPLYRRLMRQTSSVKAPLGRRANLPAFDRRLDLLQQWNVPFERNPAFVGRQRELQDLETALATSGIQAISGLGGVGKSQIAVEYAWRHRGDYQAILWVNAATDRSLDTSYAEIARLLKLPNRDAKDQTDVRDAVVEWLGAHDRWLLIFDNLDDSELLNQRFPHARAGHVVLTSRKQEFQTLGILRPLRVQELDVQDGRDFLLKRTGRDEPQAAAALARELGGLPIALEQAAAYIVELQARIESYLASYHKRQLELLDQHPPALGAHATSVNTTWALNFAEVERSPASADLLRLSAFLSPDAIPLELLSRGAVELPMSIVMADGFGDPLGPDQLLAPLTRYSLIRRDLTANTFAVHRLTQAVLRHQMNDEHQREWAERAVMVVGAAFPIVEFKTWPLCDRLLPHALTSVGWIEHWNIRSAGAVRLLNQAALYLEMRSRYGEAESLLVRALDLGRRTMGENNPVWATLLNNLANLYSTLGRSSEAETLLLEALEIESNQQEPDEKAMSFALHNLGALYRNQQRYADAEPLFRRALDIEERLFGPNSTDTASTLNGLAWLLTEANRYQEAAPLYERAVNIQTARLGEHAPDLAITLTNYGSLTAKMGQTEKAESLFTRALDIRERAFGPDHLHVANSLNQMANLYQQLGRFVDAEPLYGRALAILVNTFGSQHELAIRVRNNLVYLLRECGRAAEADALTRPAVHGT